MLETITPFFPDIQKIDKNLYSRYGDWFMPGNNAITPQFNTRMVS